MQRPNGAGELDALPVEIAEGGGESGTVGIVRCAYFPQDPRVYKEVRALLEARFRVLVFCLRMPDEPLREELGGSLAGVQVVRMDRGQTRGSMAGRMSMYLGFLFWAGYQLYRTHQRERLDIVQVNTLPDFLVFCALPVKVLGVRVVLDLHELLPELFGSEYSGRLRAFLLASLAFVEKACIAFADRVICPGPSYLEVYASRRAPLEKFTQIYNVPDESIFYRRQVDRDPNLIVAHGSVIERYGFDLIVEAMRRIVPEHPEATLEIIGDGEHMDVVRGLVERYGLGEHVRFTGRVPLETMSERLQRASLGVVATVRNPFTDRILPNKVYELIALGVPVVASETRGLVSQFGSGTISYFESGDPDDLAAKTLALLRDPVAGTRMAESAHAIYDRIRWSRNSRDYQAIFLQLGERG